MLLEVSCPFVGYDKRIESLEAKVDFFVQTQTPPLQGVFYEGQLWDACSLVEKRNKWKCCQCANVVSFNLGEGLR